MAEAPNSGRTTIDDAEVERFSKLAAEWWNPTGKFKPLHKFNPVRMAYIKEKVSAHFDRDIKATDAFAGLRILDIGCGGGLLCEPMARLGAGIVGVDASATNINVASLHAEQSGLSIDYRATTAEALSDEGETFDIILNMEVVEHVADVPLFLSECSKMLRPGGLMFVATINRTMKAWGLAIIGAEHILRWLPKGTHQYEKLVRPEEIEQPLNAQGLSILEINGVFYNPLKDVWALSNDTDVNYMMLAERPK
ncbi:bifunctional 2-polyprenyl-6-hydroxyphenol methylase/3-demethylubiquinol 3-O-methyltransferase UbiG [Pararhizobium sp. IMCC21322]|uniref:bifunctional 2-polyprenyl-6-hydroxyphenol methylase/3-demethylubiquinol 3-O-methyltransferase UbiG n=1 Tax=Pararhizobium sp. IMCC21322 TaxID=3067903 RepID=UPI0027405BDD|nr:bifunctional 2-polyprenyl-6-hydroxyphenol methylase/3-demethylubiquinol 3-O-methyltransferase UbiG [Pararhizobium sp. IMCC21322]